MFNLTQRNLRLYFRQKSAVFFSLMGVFIIIGLYALFLGDVWKENFTNVPGVDNLMNNWIIAGIISVTPVTTVMGAFGTMVEDRAGKHSKDFLAAPIRRFHIVGGYILSAYAVGVLMSLAALLVGEIYIVACGGTFLSVSDAAAVIGIILLSSLTSSSMVFFIVSFFSSNAAFTTAGTVLGTLIGFLTGIYLPVGTLPEGAQLVVRLFPVSHSGALLRQVMMREPVAVSFGGAPASYIAEFEQSMGITFTFGDYTTSVPVHLLVLTGTALLFFLLALPGVSRKAQ